MTLWAAACSFSLVLLVADCSAAVADEASKTPEPAALFKPLDRPAFPLYTISSKKTELTAEDARRLAENFQCMHGRLSKSQIAAIHKINPNFRCLIYMNSTYSRSGSDAHEAEAKYRNGLCMHLAATLKAPIDAAETKFQVAATDGSIRRGHGGSLIPIRASTIEGDVSPGDETSTKHYVFWIRIGDELMRVKAFDQATGQIEVRRGFSHTVAAPHVASDKVFSPVYLGFKRAKKAKYPGCHPEGPGKHLRYVFDPGLEPGYDFQAGLVLERMKSDGADGVWLDTLNTGDFNLSDCLGRPVRPWNFAKGQVYSYDDFRSGQERKVAYIQKYVHDRIGRYPFLVANNLKPTTYYPGHGGMRQLLASTAIKPRPLDGFCMEGGLAWQKADDEEENPGWRSRIQILMDAAQNHLAAMPILGGAGAKSYLSESDTPQRDRTERFGYASYLLGVEAKGGTLMGTYAFYRTGEKRYVKVHRMYYYPIGVPAETMPPKDIDKYRVSGTPVYRRRFTGGVVLVNPSPKQCKVELGATYLDPDKGQRVNSLEMASGTGKILLNATPTQGK